MNKHICSRTRSPTTVLILIQLLYLDMSRVRREAKVSQALVWPVFSLHPLQPQQEPRQKVQTAFIQNEKTTISVVVEPKTENKRSVVQERGK